jgi:FlaA1/EpsC-like NDP-sugar epimerase
MFLKDIERSVDALRNEIEGKSVLVIGGAGSIGSSYIKAVLAFQPKSLAVVDINENALAELVRDLRSTKGMYVPEEFHLYPMDYSSPVFEKMFRKHAGFDIVANFSAHKHVRSEKDIYSIETLLRNNVINARRLLELLTEIPPQEYFCVSTDKAANPVNIMGASKRIMEDVIFSYSDRFPVKTARFANVAFSNGSLPAGFLERIRKSQPLVAPSDVKRYFVSPQESGQICMLACMLGGNREIFFPKLKEAQMMSFDKIAVALLKEYGYEAVECGSDEEALELADKLKFESQTSGCVSEKCEGSKDGKPRYPVHFSKSDTSGEKEFEEFYTDDESVDMTRLTSLGVVVGKEIPDKVRIEKLYSRLDEAFSRETDKEEIVAVLSEYLPNFHHIETGKSLDSKM